MRFGQDYKSEELEPFKSCILSACPTRLLNTLAPHHWYIPSLFPLTVARDQAIENVRYCSCFCRIITVNCTEYVKLKGRGLLGIL